MRSYFLYFLILFFLLNASSGISNVLFVKNATIVDEPGKQVYYLFSPRVSITVPHPIANSAFKKTFTGIYGINAAFNVSVYKGLYVGVAYQNTLFKITPTKIASYNVDSLGNLNPYPTMTSNNVAIKVGYDMYLGEQNRLIYSVNVAAGNSSTKYRNLICKTPNKKPLTHFVSTYIEPEMSLFFLIESNFAIGATLSYTILNKNFNPHELCLNDWKSYSKTNEGKTQYISFGFGFYYSFFKKKH